MKKCPHSDVRWCPLYHAAHEGWGLGCDDGQLDQGTCATSRKLFYSRALWKLKAQHPGYVEQIEWNEAVAVAKAQRERNLRVNGIH